MSGIGIWVLGACFAAAACALLEMICPEGKMQRSAQTVTAIFFLCAVLLPAGKALRSISFVSSEAPQSVSVPEEFSSRIAEQSVRIARQSVESLIRGVLSRHGVTAEQIDVAAETDDGGAIRLCGTVIWLGKEDSAKERQICAWIAEELGITAECRCAG